MPRVYGSIAEAQAGIQGYKGRNAYAAAQREARRAHLNSAETKQRAAHLRHANEDHALRGVVVNAEDHVARLRGKLDAARRQATFMADDAYRTGEIHADADRIRRQVEGLPNLIERAERELADARQALADHGAVLAKPQPAAEPAPSPIEPSEEAPRGRGRPPKVMK